MGSKRFLLPSLTHGGITAICLCLAMSLAKVLRATNISVTEPGAVRDTASIALPMVIAIETDELESQLLTEWRASVGSIESLRKNVRAALEADSAMIKAKNPTFFTQGYDASVNALTKAVAKQIQERFEDPKRAPPEIAKLAAKFEQAIEEANPEIIISGNFVHADQQNNMGVMGWEQPLKAKVTGWADVSCGEPFAVKFPVNMVVGEITVPLIIAIDGTLMVKLHDGSTFGANGTWVNRPETPVSVIPAITVTYAIKLKSSDSIADGSTSVRIILPRLHGTLKNGERVP